VRGGAQTKASGAIIAEDGELTEEYVAITGWGSSSGGGGASSNRGGPFSPDPGSIVPR